MNSTLILFKEIGRQLLIVGLVLGESANSNPHPLETAASATRLLLCGNETLLATLGACAPNRLYFDLHCLCAVFRLVLDNPLHSPEARRTDHGRADTPLHKGPETGRIRDTGISLNSQKELRPDLGRNLFYAPSISCTSLSEPLTRPVSTSILNMSCPMYCQTIVTAGRDSSSAVLPPDRNAE